jgi:hypothetical protein
MRHRSFASAVIVALSACTSTRTQLKEVQVAPQLPAGRPTKALVIGLSGKPEVRSTFEKDMAGRLQEAKIAAVQSETVMPPGAPITEDMLREVVKREGADAVLIARLEGKREQQVVETAPAPTASRGFYGYYAGAAPLAYQQTYLSTEQVVTLETRLYRTDGDGQLVWRGVSDTFDAAHPSDVIRSVNEKTVAQMKKDGVL